MDAWAAFCVAGLAVRVAKLAAVAAIVSVTVSLDVIAIAIVDVLGSQARHSAAVVGVANAEAAQTAVADAAVVDEFAGVESVAVAVVVAERCELAVVNAVDESAVAAAAAEVGSADDSDESEPHAARESLDFDFAIAATVVYLAFVGAGTSSHCLRWAFVEVGTVADFPPLWHGQERQSRQRFAEDRSPKGLFRVHRKDLEKSGAKPAVE